MAFNKTDLYIETLIKEFPGEIEWDQIASNTYVSIDFIEKYFNKINIYNIIPNKNVQIEHIEKWFMNNGNKDWFNISLNPNLNDAFIRKHFPEEIFKVPYLYKFLDLNKDEFCQKYSMITHWKTFFRDFKYMCEIYEKIYNTDGWDSWLANKGFWKEIGSNPNITPRFIENHNTQIDWNSIKWNPHMTKVFIDKYAYNINWDYFVRYTNIPYEHYVCHIDKFGRDTFQYIETLPLKYVFSNYKEIGDQDIDLEFIDKNYSCVNWYLLSKNTYLSIDVIRKYKKKLNWSTICKNSFENAPNDITIINEFESNQISNNNSVAKQIIAYFIKCERFNLIEIIDIDDKRYLYITDITKDVWDITIKNKKYEIIKLDNGIEIKIGDIKLYAHKMMYNH